MKKLIKKIINVLNQSSDKIKPAIWSALIVIAIFGFKNVNPKLAFILVVICAAIMVGYFIKSIIKHEDITLKLIYIILLAMLVVLIIAFCEIIKGIDNPYIGISLPILLILLFIAMYIRIKKLGNKEKIKQTKLLLIAGMPILLVFLIFFLYTGFFK